MSAYGSAERVAQAFAHQVPDRTPLFEIFCPGHPIYWDICGRNPATDEALLWDARADGIAWEELVELTARACFDISRYFGLDVIRPLGAGPRDYQRPVKTGDQSWRLGAVDYVHNEKTHLVVPLKPLSYTHQRSEADVRRQIEQWDGAVSAPTTEGLAAYLRLRELADADGRDWLYMAEIGAGTGAAFYPPFMLMWLIEEPDLFRRWLQMQQAGCFPATAFLIEQGMTLVAMGGDVSCDKGPFISPRHYHEFLLPVIQEHVALIHAHGAQAIYTADGNHWDIQEDFFFNSGVDGYKEVDQAAGMTWPRLIEAGVDRRLCILGNLDARYTLCLGTPEQVRAEVFECLRYGQISPGGHILHASHSVHEDVKTENYRAAVAAYREYFGLEPLPD